MITIGVDAHKRVHVAVALDSSGREAGAWHGPNSPTGWAQMVAWADSHGEPRVWGIEGAWNYGRGLAQQLVVAGETVYEVNSRWTALQRRGARRPGKSDRLDAQAVAQFVRREAPRLPRVQADDVTATLDLLTSERATAQSDAIRLRNQIHALLLQLDPAYKDHLPNVRSRAWIDAVARYRAPRAGSLADVRTASVRRLAQRLRQATTQIDDLSQQIRDLATQTGLVLSDLRPRAVC